MSRRPLVPLAMVLFMALPATAWAVPKVALTAIDGDAEGEIRDAVAEALEGDELKLVGKKETFRAADKLGDLTELTEKSARKLSKELAADAIVIGTLSKDGAARVIKFKLYVNGKSRKGFSIKFKNPGSSKFKQALHKKMVEKLDSAADGGKGKGKGGDDDEPLARTAKGGKGAGGDDGEGDEAPAPRKVGKDGEGDGEGDGDGDGGAKSKAGKGGGDDDEAAPRKGGKKVGAARKAGGDDDDEPGITKRGESDPPRGRSANRAAVRLDVGASIVARRLEFNTNLAADKAPKPFKPSPVPGTRVAAELYPVAFASNGIASGIGVGFEFDRTLKMTLGTSAEPTVAIPVDQFHYAVGPRFRIVGRSPTSLSVTLGVDIGRSRFRADRSKLMDPASLDLPDTYYRFIAPGLSIRVPIGKALAFVLGGSGLLITDAGQIVRPDSYGQAKVFGVDSHAGVEVVFARRYVARLAGELTQIGYQFQGNGGALANGRDGDPTTRDVGGAADRAFGGALTFGVAY